MAESLPMNGGEGIHSYTKNSTFQGDAASTLKEIMKETLFENLDIENILSGSTTFVIADLGCSVGANTMMAMQTIIEAVEQGNSSKKQLEFHVLFNDKSSNDFNTLLASLPHPRDYFAAAVPGSFFGRLFPSSSIHIAYSSYAIHWLSKPPEGLQVRDSPAWNVGRIHYGGASDAVVRAYTDQFVADMEVFFRARAQEITPGGMIVIITMGVAHRADTYPGAVAIKFIESVLMDMVKEGVVEQEQVDSFNLPMVYPSLEDVRGVVEKNGCFEFVRSEIVGYVQEQVTNACADPERVINHFRAASEGIIRNHFGNEISNQLFKRALQQKLKLNWGNMFDSTPVGQLFVVLKRK